MPFSPCLHYPSSLKLRWPKRFEQGEAQIEQMISHFFATAQKSDKKSRRCSMYAVSKLSLAERLIPLSFLL